uniref:Uncharacterized protein n=1 Tax=Magallana gigas TaxID=29159 RepID=K1RQP8_MAGGI
MPPPEDQRHRIHRRESTRRGQQGGAVSRYNQTPDVRGLRHQQVRTECLDNVSQYTPISTFSDQGNDMAAFLIDCTKTDDDVISGLTIALQTCNDAPMVMKLNETTTPRMSDFYTILQRKRVNATEIATTTDCIAIVKNVPVTVTVKTVLKGRRVNATEIATTTDCIAIVKKISVIESIAENLHVEDSRAEPCPVTTKHQTSEAFVINKCNSTARSSWSKGEQVKMECSKNTISPYTPISTFFVNGDNMAAFFIGCTATADGENTGLTIAVQTCLYSPMVMQLNETTTPKMSKSRLAQLSNYTTFLYGAGDECTHDSHCTNCAVGQTGKCHRHHDTERKFCQCEEVGIQTIFIVQGNAQTTTVKSPLKLECSHRKISVIESIAENLHVEDNRAELCPDTTKHQTSEAFVINKCNSTARSSWLKGESVKSLCSSGSITQYTPISTFHQNENMAAFFIDCSASNHELKVAVQTCTDPPYILMLNDTTSPKMSDFYIILQQV